MIPARRVAEIPPFHVMEILAEARRLEAAGRDIVHMEVGEPDFPTPEPVLAAAEAALRRHAMHYTSANGLPALREAIAGHYRRRHGVEVAPGRIIVTPGSSAALLLALAAVVNPGEKVLMADPGYPCNPNFVRTLNGVPVFLPVEEEGGYQATPEQLRAAWDAESRAFIAASPANPTGAVLGPRRLRGLVEAVADLGGIYIADEIYQGLVYGDAAPSVLEITDQAIVVNSFSKYFHMTGWRLGWVVLPEALVRPAEKLMQNLFIAAPTPAQHAALAVFSPEAEAILEDRRRQFQARRDFLLPALRELGLVVRSEPAGAFYLYADSRAWGGDSFALAQALLHEAGVAATPGIDFGRHRAAEHLRFAYTTSLERLALGVERLGRFLASNPI